MQRVFHGGVEDPVLPALAARVLRAAALDACAHSADERVFILWAFPRCSLGSVESFALLPRGRLVVFNVFGLFSQSRESTAQLAGCGLRHGGSSGGKDSLQKHDNCNTPYPGLRHREDSSCPFCDLVFERICCAWSLCPSSFFLCQPDLSTSLVKLLPRLRLHLQLSTSFRKNSSSVKFLTMPAG